MSRFITQLEVFTVLALLLSGCGDKAADASKTDAPKAAAEKEAPKTEKPADKPAATGACDVTVTAGAAGPAVELEDGKTYCLGDLRLTRETRLEEVREKLGDCAAQENRGATLMQCKGAQWTFAGPTLHLTQIEPTAE